MTRSSGNRRRSIRLRGYDYSRPGAYFVTICTQSYIYLFGRSVAGKMVLNDAGQMVQSVWDELPVHSPGIEADAFVVMPNHIHAIVVIQMSLPDVVHRFKTLTTRRYTDAVRHSGWEPFPGRLWQRNYWEHVIRSERELHRVREYIVDNPAKWESDRLYGPPSESSSEDAEEEWMV